MEAEAPGGFDDVIVLDPTPEVLDALPPVLAPAAVVNMVGDRPLGRPVRVDAGRVHYDYTVYLGTLGPDISSAYGETRNRAEVRAGRNGLDHRRRRPDGPHASPAHA